METGSDIIAGMALPFSKRTTTAVTVFACLQISKQAQPLTTVVSQVSALQLEMAALFHIYRRVLHQDVANQAAVLAEIISLAAASIQNLSTILNAITPPSNPDQAIVLADYQLILKNAVVVMASVQAAE